ncbi:MAG: hypothetical protein AAGB04_29070 [Pseudomonadota bacterium]
MARLFPTRYTQNSILCLLEQFARLILVTVFDRPQNDAPIDWQRIHVHLIVLAIFVRACRSDLAPDRLARVFAGFGGISQHKRAFQSRCCVAGFGWCTICIHKNSFSQYAFNKWEQKTNKILD